MSHAPKGLYREGGRWIIGNLLTEQKLWKIIDKPRKCTARGCGQPTIVTTKLGRPVHPACEGWTDHLTAPAFAQVIFGIAHDLGATEIEQ